MTERPVGVIFTADTEGRRFPMEIEVVNDEPLEMPS